MFLYNREGNNIEVYPLDAKKEKIMEYKENEMGKIIENLRVFKAKTNSKELLDTKEEIIWGQELNQEESGSFHYFNTSQLTNKEKIRQAKLLKRYYEGAFDKAPIKLVADFNERLGIRMFLQYLLLTIDEYYKEPYSNLKKMGDIISLPRSLYLLHLLQNGKYYELLGENIEEQLKLFTVSSTPSKVVNINELKQMFSYTSGEKGYVTSMGKVEASQLILEKMQK